LAQQAAIAIGNAKLYADLRSAYAQLEAAQEQAVQTAKLGALSQMAGGVAHDFNNLLAAILGRAELLQRRTSDPLVVQGLKIIQGAALDGAETVRRILGFARASFAWRPRSRRPLRVHGALHATRTPDEPSSPRPLAGHDPSHVNRRLCRPHLGGTVLDLSRAIRVGFQKELRFPTIDSPEALPWTTGCSATAR
jgi:signal transduction histidine kinase